MDERLASAKDDEDDTGPPPEPEPRLGAGPEDGFHPVWVDPSPRNPEDDRALARMLGWAVLVGIGLWIAVIIALL